MLLHSFPLRHIFDRSISIMQMHLFQTRQPFSGLHEEGHRDKSRMHRDQSCREISKLSVIDLTCPREVISVHVTSHPLHTYGRHASSVGQSKGSQVLWVETRRTKNRKSICSCSILRVLTEKIINFICEKLVLALSVCRK